MTHNTQMVIAQLKKAMQKAYQRRDEVTAEAIKQEINRLERRNAA